MFHNPPFYIRFEQNAKILDVNRISIITFTILFIIPLTACSKKAEVSQNPITAQNNLITSNVTSDIAFKNALNLYSQKKTEGVDLTNGPCLGNVAPDWVADIAHNPRQSIDDKEENQCADFKNGLAHHFIELDPEGKLIRSY